MNVPVPAAADLRLLRATLFSAVCVALSAGGHLLASGGAIPLWSLAAGGASILCLVSLLAGRERALPGIVLALLGGEVDLHLVFSLGQGSATSAQADRSSRVVAMAEHLLCGATSAHLTPDSAAGSSGRRISIPRAPSPSGTPHRAWPRMAGMSGHGTHAMMLSSMFTAPMVVAHFAAAVITGWVLRRCEVAAWPAPSRCTRL